MVRASKLSPEQRLEMVVAFLGGKASMAELCREHGVSSQTIYVWRDKFLEGGLRGLQGNGPSEREETLERENAKLKELLGEISMANYVLKRGESLHSKQRGAGVKYLIDRGIPARRACALVGLAKSSYYYEPIPRMPRPVDQEVRRVVLEISEGRPSFGHRRMTAMVKRALARPVNEKAVRRVMRLEQFTLDPCVQRRGRIPKQRGLQLSIAPDMAYQMGMKYIICGRDGYGYLQSVVDTCKGEWLGYVFSTRPGSKEACDALDRVVMNRFPKTCLAPGTRLRLDNGTQYTAMRFHEHAKNLGFVIEHIQVQTPEDNGMIESFHAGLARDYLDYEDVHSFEEANRFLEKVFIDYNEVKPKKRLGWRTPKEYYQEMTPNASKTL